MEDDDFFEEDEPIEAVKARRERPYDVVAARPQATIAESQQVAALTVREGAPG